MATFTFIVVLLTILNNQGGGCESVSGLIPAIVWAAKWYALVFVCYFFSRHLRHKEITFVLIFQFLLKMSGLLVFLTSRASYHSKVPLQVALFVSR